MKKSFKLLAVVAAVFMALTFTGCAELANALGGALFGQNQTLKVTSSKSEWNNGTVSLTAVEMVEDGNGGYKASSNVKSISLKINGNKQNISKTLETRKCYSIYIDAAYNSKSGTIKIYPNTIEEKAKIKQSGSTSLTTVNKSDDIFSIAGDIDYEIELTLAQNGTDIVGTIKGTRQTN